MTYTICELCGEKISISNYSKHLRRHQNHPETFNISKWRIQDDRLNCQYCGKQCKNKNSLSNHERLCSKNPNAQESHIATYTKIGHKAWNKGLTKETSEIIQKQSIVLKESLRKRKESFKHIHAKENQQEINKWLSYIKNITIPKVNYTYNKYITDGYKTISRKSLNSPYEVKNRIYCFEHDFIANILLNGHLLKEYSVHHIDKDRNNNDKNNLIIFQTKKDHLRFHSCEDAIIHYDDVTHTFTTNHAN